MPRVDGLIHTILIEAYSSRYSIHPGATKMYRDLKQHFWWSRMKRDIVDFVAQCPNGQQVKYEHQRPRGTLQRMSIPEWKWERIAMDFMVGLPKTLGKFDSLHPGQGDLQCREVSQTLHFGSCAIAWSSTFHYII